MGTRTRRTLLVAAVLSHGVPLGAAELEARTVTAYDEYLSRVRRAFLARVGDDSSGRMADGVGTGRPGGEDGIISVPGGLVHHWIGSAFVGGASLADALEVSQAYADYSTVHEPIIASKILSRTGDTFRVLIRLKEGEAGITAVLDIRSTVEYVRRSGRSAYAISRSDELREVQNAGETDERLLPAGRDNGYLWRAHTFSRFVERDGGVFVEMETLGLSRRFPPLLGWFIEPIARRMGRKSVEASLREFSAAVRKRLP